MKNITGCSCEHSNDIIFCERHNVEKSSHFVDLCKYKQNYFDAWEEGRGPGQKLSNQKNSLNQNSNTVKKCGGCSKNKPSTIDKAKSLVEAVSKFAMSGFETVDSETKNSRLEICNSCDRMNKENRTCLECGCFLDIKTGWATEKCPIGKWDTVVQIQKPGGCGGCSQKKSE